MSYLATYTCTIRERGNELLAQSIKKTADDMEEKCLRDFDYASHELGLLFGNVQSGKTAQMFGIICQAADDGFAAFILLTTDNVALQQQTLHRVERDLDGFCICGENDGKLFADNRLEKPVIIVLKKNARVLKLWANILRSTSFMQGNPLFVLDDEADAASLNTLVNNMRQSSINRYLQEIRDQSSSSIYLQVTGTPQALLLQTKLSTWQPSFTYYFRPGKGYLGGDFFFPAGKQPDCITELTDEAAQLYEAVWHHLLVSAQILLSGGRVCNFLIHPSVRTASHESYAQQVRDGLARALREFDRMGSSPMLKKLYDDLAPQKSTKLPLDRLLAKARELLDTEAVKILIMNGTHETPAEAYATGSNIVIGGNTLGRGVTFDSLHTIYYTRTSKHPQADTMWQHSRMFGYDRDPGLIRLYIEDRLYRLFADINTVNNVIIAQIERGIENVKIYYPETLNPTRTNVIDKGHVFTIAGGKNYFPSDPQNKTIDDLTKLLQPFDENVPSYQVSLHLVRQILEHIATEQEFRLPSFLSFIDAFLADHPSAQAQLIVRRDRDIRKGSRALLSPNDWKLGEEFTASIVLTMYQVTGKKGWNGKKIWVPNIKLPDQVDYYDIEE